MTARRQPLVYVLWGVLIVMGAAAGTAVHRLWDLRNGIESLADQLSLEIGPESTLLFDANEQVLSAIYEEHRIAVPLDGVSPHLINAVLVTEDRRFYEHDGVDLPRIVMAGVANLRAGEIVQGGSTITQQLVRSIILDRERRFMRKFKEAVLARRLEERYSKRAILEAYLNRVYFGDGYYGIEAAALGYFGKPAADLDPVESATLAGLIKGPSLYSPTKAPELAKARRDLVLHLMREQGLLDGAAYQAAVATPVRAMLARGEKARRPDLRRARGGEYFREAVVRELVQRFGADLVYTGGLRVYTTLDRRLQMLAEATVAEQASALARGDREPPQGALVTIDPRTGEVKALVGGRSFDESPFNRAIDAKRQPGSAFKPFVYALALESGYGLASVLNGLDEPIPTNQGPWLPGGEHERTSVRLRDALVLSSNRAAAHLLQEVGVERTRDLVQRFGVTSPMPHVASLALGTGEMSLLELTSAYAVFANSGVWHPPTLIRRIVDREGNEIYRAPQTERAVVSDATAYMMTSMMADVIERGTATTARKAGFHQRAAGKTGTSQSYADAWFVGYTPRLVTGVWFGYDTPQSIMKGGFAGVVAVPAWARFMAGALDGDQGEWFERPGSVSTVAVCRLSGRRATERCDLPVTELPAYVAEHPNWYAEPIVREGGTYTELRHAGRMPELCDLPHGEGIRADADLDTAAAAISVSDARVGADAAPAGATVIVQRSSAPIPASLRPAAQPAVMTIVPATAVVTGAALPRPPKQ